MKELEQFSEERLIEISRFKQASELAALARIALAAKKAIPSYWITYYPNPDPNEFDDREHSHSGAKSCAVRIAGEIGGFVVPVYHGTPPLNSPETPDGWVACIERMPTTCIEIVIRTRHGELIAGETDVVGFLDLHDGTSVRMSEATHWMPLPAAPKPEK